MRAVRTVLDFYRTCKVNKNSLSRSDFFAMMIRGKEDMKNDLTVDCTIFPLETVRIYVETIMGISKKPISLEILLDLIRFLLDFGKAERGRNYLPNFVPVLVVQMSADKDSKSPDRSISSLSGRTERHRTAFFLKVRTESGQ